jgi:hypothetical protein
MIEDEITRTTLRHLQTFGPKSGSRSDEKKNRRFIRFFPYRRRTALRIFLPPVAADADTSNGLPPKPAPKAGASLVAAKLGALNVPKPWDMAGMDEALPKVKIPGAAAGAEAAGAAADGVAVEPKLNEGVGLNMGAVVD